LYSYREKTALITGASFGIGEVFAHALAERGMHVILVARSEERLRELATSLVDNHSIRAEVIVADLSQTEAPAHIFQAVQDLGLSVDLLVNNAGFGTTGAFVGIDPAVEQQLVMVNVAAVVDLTHAFLPQMLERKDGAVLNVASLASFLPNPYGAVYAASKAFVLSLSVALWEECRHSGVRVVALCPALVRTHFFEASGIQMPADGAGTTISSPETVVAAALRALERGKIYVIPGRMNYFLGNFVKRVLPLGTVAKMVAKQLK
jgi:uncharacterized protein